MMQIDGPLRSAVLREDLSSFIASSFAVLNPGTPFLPNWHVELIADYLEACDRGDIKRLIINLPPRSLKSFCVSVAWQEVATVWAGIKPIKPKEIFANGKVENITSYQVLIRYMSGVKPSMHLLYDGRVMNIRGVVNPDEGGELLELLAEEGVDE
jgi:SPP1 family predicted phage head-tail adaptor